jgi:antitoxin VapB
MRRSERRVVSLFRNKSNQAVRIPVEFELPGTKAIMRREGDRLIIEAARKRGLAELLASWEPLNEDEKMPDTEDHPLKPEDIF